MNAIEASYRAFLKRSFPLPSEDRVGELETRLGVPLPSDYRRFIMEYNGGYFLDPEIHVPVDACAIDALDVLAGVGATNPFDELGAAGGFTPAIFDDNEPVEFLPIGYTLAGNLLYMDVRSTEYRGAIWMKIANSDKCIFLADGIDQFFRQLRQPRVDS
jgi:hypothetical protein